MVVINPSYELVVFVCVCVCARARSRACVCVHSPDGKEGALADLGTPAAGASPVDVGGLAHLHAAVGVRLPTRIRTRVMCPCEWERASDLTQP